MSNMAINVGLHVYGTPFSEGVEGRPNDVNQYRQSQEKAVWRVIGLFMATQTMCVDTSGAHFRVGYAEASSHLRIDLC